MVRVSEAKAKELALIARETRKNAHAPYSGFHVGSALLTSDDKIYTGCNVENSSYSLTNCAERTAIFKAISEGESKFKAIAVASDSPDFLPPCGACRQVIADICGNIDVVMIDEEDSLKILSISELLPLAFSGDQIKPEGK
ncbi:MAG: cytidine deaminase [Ignavibacteriales bacterium]|nr:MAG: cytidine deaminase [Ignavibacteriales bacterium]